MRGLPGDCRFLATWRVLTLAAVLAVTVAVVAASPGIASASSAPHRAVRHGAHGSGLTLAQAPAGLRAAVRRTLGAPAAAASSAFQKAKLTASDGVANDEFGWSVAVSGSTAVVGAISKNADAGAAYVYLRSASGHWSQQAELTASDGVSGDDFGVSVAIAGATAVVGADATNSGTGAAYVFTRSGTAWSQQAELTAANGAAGDDFGGSVAIAGSTAVVGAPFSAPGTGAAYVFTRSGTAWSQQARLTAANGAFGDNFGWSVAISGSTAMVGAVGTNGLTGAAYVFTRSGTAWSQQAELVASDGAAGDHFGWSIGLSGSTAVIGAPFSNSNTGAAYVFTRSGTAWSQQAKLTAADGASGDTFGNSVALAGTTAVVGAPFNNSNTGAAYVFTRSGTAWSQQAKLTAADGASGDILGWSVAISGSTAMAGADGANSGTGAAYVFVLPSQQATLAASVGTSGYFGFTVALSGSTAVVGADGANSNTGAAYVFVRSGTGTWSQQAKLTAANGATGDDFGWSVAIAGSTAVVGADGTAGNTGAAYVFVRSGTGTWSQQAKLTAANGATGDDFGWSVAIAGSTAVVGADGTAGSTGAAYVFTRSASGHWSQQAKLTATDGAANDFFGWSAAIAGSTAVVSADGTAGSTGAAYVFTRSASGHWSQQAKLTATDGAANDFFGNSVAVSGSTAVVGAPFKNSNTGAAYVFTRSGTAWSQQAKLTAADGAANGYFGYSAALSGSTAVVGAIGNNSSAGAAYVFTRSGTAWSQQAELTAANGATGDDFGYSVALSKSTAVVGAPGKKSSTGTAYVFANV